MSNTSASINPMGSLNLASQAPIGIFDSGVGGITVLKAIASQLPHESLLYFGDTARVPYGTRSLPEILQFVREILFWMQRRGAKLVVMACNTSSALVLDIVRTEFKIPILGVILPAARIAATCGNRIGVLATPATAASRAYTHAMLEHNSAAKIWEVGCPEFVPLIEQNKIFSSEAASAIELRLTTLIENNIDVLVYGCTHYPHLKPVVDCLIPPSIIQVDPADHAAQAVDKELDILGLKRNSVSVAREIQFFVSSQPEKFASVSSQWLDFLPNVSQITLELYAHTGRF